MLFRLLSLTGFLGLAKLNLVTPGNKRGDMGRTTKTITLSLPPEMVDEIDELMKEEGKTRSELLREALRQYVEDREWREILKYGRARAKEKGITEDQVEDIVDAYRK